MSDQHTHQMQRLPHTGRRLQTADDEPRLALDIPVADGWDTRRRTVRPERDLARYVDVIRRRWRLGLPIALVVVGGVAAGTMMQDPVYRATGLLEIRQGAEAVPVETLFSSQRVAGDDLETQFGILRSATLAERVVTSLREAPDEPTQAAAPPSAPTARAPAAPAERKPVRPARISMERFRSNLIVNPQRGSRLVEVSFDSSNRELAARVVNTVFDTYLQMRMEEAQRSADWLETQLESTQGRLEDTERQLQTYVRQHGVEVLETGQGETAKEVNERLRLLSESLAEARTQRFEKQSAYELAPKQAASRDVTGPVAENLSVRLADLRRERAKLASVFHDEYPSVKALNSQISELENALNAETQQAVSRVNREYRAALRREALLREALDRQSAAAQSLAQTSSGYQSLKREVVTNQELFALLNQKLKEVSISAALRASNVGIVDRPKPPQRPRNSPLWLNVGMAVVVALVLALGAVFLREHLDSSVRSVEDVDSYLGVPTLAAIPAVGVDRRALPPGTVVGPRGPWRRIDRDGVAGSTLSDAFAALRAAVLLDQDGPAPRILLVTSAQSAEGKTTVSINLALSLARLKNRVLLIDANMRFPCVHEAFGLENEHGLVGYLGTDVFWRAFVHESVQPGLDLVVCGGPGASPADLLSLPRMRELVAAASREYDFVVMDSPALLAHPADVRSLAAIADNVLLTVRQGATPREAVSFALSQLPHVIGVVMNRADSRDIPAYYRDVTLRSA